MDGWTGEGLGRSEISGLRCSRSFVSTRSAVRGLSLHLHIMICSQELGDK